MIQNNAATDVSDVDDLAGLTISDPPTQFEMQIVLSKLNELIGALKA